MDATYDSPEYKTTDLRDGMRVLVSGAEVPRAGEIFRIDEDDEDNVTASIVWDDGCQTFDMPIEDLIPVEGWVRRVKTENYQKGGEPDGRNPETSLRRHG